MQYWLELTTAESEVQLALWHILYSGPETYPESGCKHASIMVMKAGISCKSSSCNKHT